MEQTAWIPQKNHEEFNKVFAQMSDSAVPKRYRGHGIATAIVRHILRIAEEAGLKGTVLVASPMGQPVYERIGFLPLCRMDNLIYRGEYCCPAHTATHNLLIAQP